MSLKEYFRLFTISLNPFKYDYLSEKILKISLKQYFTTLFIMFAILLIMLSPKLLFLSDEIESTLSNFDTLELNIDFSTNKETTIFNIFTFNSNESKTPTNEKILITKKYIYCNSILCKPFLDKITPIENFENIKENPAPLKNLLKSLIVFSLPVLIILAFILYSIKYITIIIVSSIIIYSITILTKFSISLMEIFKIGLFASTALTLTIYSSYFPKFLIIIFYSTFFIYLILGTIKAGSFNNKSKQNKD